MRLRVTAKLAHTNAVHTRNVGASSSPHTRAKGPSVKCTLPWTSITIAKPPSATSTTPRPRTTFVKHLPSRIASAPIGVVSWMAAKPVLRSRCSDSTV